MQEIRYPGRRFHLLGLVHLPIHRQYSACAFTQKTYKLAKMLLSLGHEVIVYGAEGSDVPCTEFVQTHTLHEIRQTWGNGDNRFEIGYNWQAEQFRHDLNTERKPLTGQVTQRCIDEINRRKLSDDFLLVMQGTYQKPIADGVGLWLTVEPGIGYRGSFARFKAFESAYLQNFTYGSRYPHQSIDGNWYDRVIPNYFEAEDFPFVAQPDDYLVYVGRLIQRKGVDVAIKAARATGHRLLLAGQGTWKTDYDRAEFVGFVGPEDRAALMGHAVALFAPTLYLEPFGGVAVEAQMCGTPAITTDFGAFPETVRHGETGFRCNTLDDFVQATIRAPHLDRVRVHDWGQRFACHNVKWEFQRWFDDLYQLYKSAHEKSVLGWHFVGTNKV